MARIIRDLNDILPALKGKVSPLSSKQSLSALRRVRRGFAGLKENVVSASIHPRNELRGFLEASNKNSSVVAWNKAVSHPIQSWEWGEFRKKTGVIVLRRGIYDGEKLLGGFQLTIHRIPGTSLAIGYLPKGPLPTKEIIGDLKKIGKQYNCIFIQLEPNVETNQKSKGKNQNYKLKLKNLGLRPSLRPLFTKYNLVIDLTKGEGELLASMHPKTRYNIRVAQRYGVKVEERTDDEAFKIYLKLYFETTKRQHYFGHTPEYHRLLWETLKPTNHKSQITNHKLTARILIAYYTPPTPATQPTTRHSQPIPLATWMLLKFGDTLYYPYGGSSEKYKNVMASNLMMWEAIRFSKKLGLKTFDMWGALGPDADTNDPWYGFHRFKLGYRGKLVEYLGSYDLVLNPLLYWGFHLIDKIRLFLVRLKS